MFYRHLIVVRLIFITLLICRTAMISVCEEEKDYPKPSPVMMEALMQLQLADLLRIKHNWQMISCNCENCDKESSERQHGKGNKSIDSEEGAKALPLTASKRSSDSWLEEQDDEEEERPTKLQSIFNASITGLALLSFGGYLLCLVIQAIRSKGATYLYPIITNQTANSFGASKIKIFRRSKRQATGGGHTSKRNISGYTNSDEETDVTDGSEDASDDDSDVQVSVDDHESDEATDDGNEDDDDDDDDVRWKSVDPFDAIKLFAETLKQMEGGDRN